MASLLPDFSIYSLWMILIPGWVIIVGSMGMASRMRGALIEDPGGRKKGDAWTSGLPNIVLLILAIFTPLQRGLLFELGIIACFLGLGIVLQAAAAFANGGSGLVTTGIFRISRNPVYVGHFVMLTGIVLIAMQASPLNGTLAALIFLWFLIISHRAVLEKEQFLAEKYGEEYLHYKNLVRRYLGIKR